MTREKLEKLLADGAITQEEFDEMIKNVKEAETNPETDPETDTDALDLDKIDKLVQSRVDKRMADAGKKYADLEKKYKRLQQEKLTDEELKKATDEERERVLAEREKAILDKENRLYAVKAIREAGLDDGKDTALALVDFVMGEDETEINGKVKAFKELFDKAVEAEVDKRFKANGYTPKKSETLNGGVNPYTKEQFNFTEQMRLEQSNPELAAQLKAAAGVK